MLLNTPFALMLALQAATPDAPPAMPTPTPAPAPAPASGRVAPPATAPSAGPSMTLDEAKMVQCRQAIDTDANEGVIAAGQWVGENANSPQAHQCLGLAYSRLQNFGPAASAFAEAARVAASSNPNLSAAMYVQAGSAALADGDAPGARTYLDQAIAGTLTGKALGEAYVERARAAVVANDPVTARADLEAALRLPTVSDPLVWLLSATLHRRQRELPQAQADIQQAAALAPRDARIALEAGNIAVAAGNLSAARTSWQSAISIDGTGIIGNAARAHLAELDRFEREEGVGTSSQSGGTTAPSAPPAAPPPSTAPSQPPHSGTTP